MLLNWLLVLAAHAGPYTDLQESRQRDEEQRVLQWQAQRQAEDAASVRTSVARFGQKRGGILEYSEREGRGAFTVEFRTGDNRLACVAWQRCHGVEPTYQCLTIPDKQPANFGYLKGCSLTR